MVAEWIAALAATGGAALVGAAATDAWAMTRTGFVRLFGRGDSRQQELVESRLDATAAEIEQAAEADREQVRRTAAAVWQTRLADLLEEDPDAAEAVRVLTDQIISLLPQQDQLSVQAINTGPAFVAGGGVANTGVVMGNVSAVGGWRQSRRPDPH